MQVTLMHGGALDLGILDVRASVGELAIVIGELSHHHDSVIAVFVHVQETSLIKWTKPVIL